MICVQIVESADLVITLGTVWTDYSTVGYSLLLNPNKVIKVCVCVRVCVWVGVGV